MLNNEEILKIIEAVGNINTSLNEQGLYGMDGDWVTTVEIIPWFPGDFLLNVKFGELYVWTSDEDIPKDSNYESWFRNIIMIDIEKLKEVKL